MRALQLPPAADTLVFVEAPTPSPARGEVLIRVRAAGICRTDVHLIQRSREFDSPRILGHEISGDVAALGPGVAGLAVGERVIAHHKLVCGTCGACTRGRETLCRNARVLGIDLDGGFAEYVRTDASRVLPLPSSVPYATGAALTCAGVTAYHALRSVAHLRPSETTLVLGTGGVGQFAVQIARQLGSEVIAADVRPEALQRAAELGASQTVRVDPDSQVPLAKVLGPDRVDVALDLVGDSEMASGLVDALRPGGRYVITSGGPEDWLRIPPFSVFRRELGVVGARGSSLEELRDVVDLAASGFLSGSIAIQSALMEGPSVIREVEMGHYVGRAILLP